jgi:predicted DCC family thiol-disulfide oxidoreductase YuxK
MSQQLTVYFDGLCPLCSREIKFYRSKASSTKIDWQDITEPGFDPGSHGLDAVKIHQSFHVKTMDGKVIAGVEAFIQIWKTMPEFSSWAKASALPGVLPILRISYALFAKLRPHLPRAKRCEDQRCSTGPSSSRI